MFSSSVYFLQQPILFLAITLLLLRHNLSYCYSATKKVLKKNRICIMPYRQSNTIIQYHKKRKRVGKSMQVHVFDFKTNM